MCPGEENNEKKKKKQENNAGEEGTHMEKNKRTYKEALAVWWKCVGVNMLEEARGWGKYNLGII